MLASRHGACRGWIHPAMILCPVAVAVLALSGGCRRYPLADHAEAIVLVSSLRTACSAQKPEWLEQSEAKIESYLSEGLIDQSEYDALTSIVQLAKDENWEQAEKECHRFQKDQVR